jgi:hypothetical protein
MEYYLLHFIFLLKPFSALQKSIFQIGCQLLFRDIKYVLPEQIRVNYTTTLKKTRKLGDENSGDKL